MDATRCVNCTQPMQLVALAGHYGRGVDVDMCGPCRLVWFDNLESVNLNGPGTLQLLRAIDAQRGELLNALGGTDLPCPRCTARLKVVRDLVSHGPVGRLECPRGHGALQTFSQLLAEKGLVRPLFRPEVEQLQRSPATGLVFHCVNCGAEFDPRVREACSFCGSPRLVLDLQRILHALDRQTGVVDSSVGGPPRQVQFTCMHCGGAIDAARERRCSHCAMPIAVTDVAEVLRLIEPYAAKIESGEAAPAHRAVEVAEVSDGRPHLLPMGLERNPLGPPWWVYAFCAVVAAGAGLALVRCVPLV
ncbi:hypothetical protein [Ramlibacter albus]|uniref:Transcription factor zinc-finger domain-containing protein n=1 Tax=Ramlibacter albus TaxID=2079448 RepID=A0A923S2Y5_9BURK|nr:hypothetical protein [Ramlibacter albus]MBC5765964.1 hypothetical protein [Ramlibacter albus]